MEWIMSPPGKVVNTQRGNICDNLHASIPLVHGLQWPKGEITMELIEFAEQQGQEAAKFSLATLDGARLRCHQFLVLLLGGAGALSGVGLAQLPQNLWVALAALAAALWWFSVAAWVAVRGLRSSPVSAWAHEGTTVLAMQSKWDAYNAALAQEGKPSIDVLTEVRRSTLRSMQASAEQYRTASTYAARALDQAYVATAFTPAPLLLAALLANYFG